MKYLKVIGVSVLVLLVTYLAIVSFSTPSSRLVAERDVWKRNYELAVDEVKFLSSVQEWEINQRADKVYAVRREFESGLEAVAKAVDRYEMRQACRVGLEDAIEEARINKKVVPDVVWDEFDKLEKSIEAARLWRAAERRGGDQTPERGRR